jgi:hypothetical protein
MSTNPITLDIAYTCWIRYPSRLEYFQKSVASVQKNLNTDNLKVNWVVSSEIEHNVLGYEFEDFCNENHIALTYRLGKPNLAANLNHLFGTCCQSEMVLYIQDDWTLNKELYLYPDIQFLLTNHDYGVVRYYAVPNSCFTESPSPRHPDIYPIKKTTPYYFTDNPHLRKGSVHSIMGTYTTRCAPDGSDHSLGEMDMNDRFKGLNFAPRVALKGEGDHFGHIGTESSLTEKWTQHAKDFGPKGGT